MINMLTLSDAAAAINRGGVIAYPTEGVWGLGCDPMNQAAVRRLLDIKQRPVDKGLILIAAHLDQLKPFLDLPALPANRLVDVLATWPGPHTWVVPARASAPRWITGAHDGIAVRISAHPMVIALCDAFGGALVSTSANPAGKPAPSTRDGIDADLLARIDGVVEGQSGGLDRATPIRDARDGAVLRN